MSDEPARTKSVSSRAIDGRQRWICGVVAILGLGGGGVAVFESANQAGTVALLTIGAFAALFCLIGAVPLRWSVGNAGFDMSETVEAIVDVVSAQLTADQLRAASAEIRATSASDAEPNGITQRLADGLASASQFERTAHGRLAEAARSLEWRYRQDAVFRRTRPNDRQAFQFEADGLFETTVEHQIAIEMKASTNTNRVFGSVRQMTALLAAGAVDGAIVAVNGPVPQKVQEYLDETDGRIVAIDLSRAASDLIPTLQALELRIADARPNR